MPQMSVTVPHALGQEKATERLNEKLEQIKEKHQYEVRDLVETRPDPHTLRFSFKALGFGVSGECFSRPDSVTIDLDLPVAAMLVQPMIRSQLIRELTSVLS